MREHFDRLLEIATATADAPPEMAERKALLREIAETRRAIKAAYQDRVATQGPPTNTGTSEPWIFEKADVASTYAAMAVDPTQRSGVKTEEILEGIRNYAFLASVSFEEW